MKETERRADKWRDRFGVEQTEIDALATLRPQELTKIVKAAIAPYWDKTLHARTLNARNDAQREASQILSEIVEGHRDRFAAAEVFLAAARVASERVKAELDPILVEIRTEATAALQEIELEAPKAEPEGDIDTALFCSSRDWVEQTEILRDEKL